jgi:hypothetical protein
MPAASKAGISTTGISEIVVTTRFTVAAGSDRPAERERLAAAPARDNP